MQKMKVRKYRPDLQQPLGYNEGAEKLGVTVLKVPFKIQAQGIRIQSELRPLIRE